MGVKSQREPLLLVNLDLFKRKTKTKYDKVRRTLGQLFTVLKSEKFVVKLALKSLVFPHTELKQRPKIFKNVQVHLA